MKKLFNLILILAVAVLMVMTRANAIGTTANTVIDSTATSVTLSYSGYAVVTFNLTTAPQVTKLVGAVYGFNFYSSVTANLYSPTVTSAATAAGTTVNLYQNIVNLSNDTITVSVQTSGNAYSVTGNPGTLANWMFIVTNQTDNLNLGEVTNSWQIKIKPAANAFNLSRAGMVLNVFMPGYTTANTQYSGYNGTVYGGYNQFGYDIAATISGPDLVLQNRYSVVSTIGLNGYSGNSSDLVPGAKVTYTIVVKNQGGATANSVVIEDKIPTNTKFFAFPAGDFTTVYLDTNLSTITIPSSVSADVKYLRFNKANIGPGSSATINYEVTVD